MSEEKALKAAVPDGAGGAQTDVGAAKPLSFEEGMERLEEIVRSLESGELTLDASLKLFQEGVALAHLCSRKLDEAQARVEKLTEGAEGFRLETFEVEDDST